jgi:hypothetical protein
MYNNKVTFLNKEVEAEVKAEVKESLTLYIAWRLSYGRYDDEIHPLHNPYYVKENKENEIKQLKELKDRLKGFENDYRKEFKEL